MTREPTGALRRGLPWTRDRGWGATDGAPPLTVPHGGALLPFGHALLTTVALHRFPEKVSVLCACASCCQSATTCPGPALLVLRRSFRPRRGGGGESVDQGWQWWWAMHPCRAVVVPLAALMGRNREPLVVLTASDDRGSRCFSAAFESLVLGAHRLFVTALTSSLATAHCGTLPSAHALVQGAVALFIDMVRLFSARRGGAPTGGGGHAFYALLRFSCFDVFGRCMCGDYTRGGCVRLCCARAMVAVAQVARASSSTHADRLGRCSSTKARFPSPL